VKEMSRKEDDVYDFYDDYGVHYCWLYDLKVQSDFGGGDDDQHEYGRLLWKQCYFGS